MRVPASPALRHGIKRMLRGTWAHAGLLLVLAVALAERIALLRWWKAFPGGDTYNFILIAQELLRGSYPIAEKRLPVYPILIAATHTILDWEKAAVAVAAAASLVSLVLFYALCRTLKLSKTASVVALLPFQAVAPFLFQSIRGYADTTFVALCLGSLLLFLRSHTWRGAAGLGATLGAAALTRPEGAAFATAVLLLVTGSRKRRLFLPTVLTAAVLGSAFAALSLKAGRPLLPREYLLDAEVSGFGVTTAREFMANYGVAWAGVGFDRLWGEPLRLLRDASSTPLRNVPRRAVAFLTDPKELPSLLLLSGALFLLLRRRRVLPALLLPFLALAAPIAWWGVRQRFLVVLYPLFFLLLAAGAHSAIAAGWTQRKALPAALASALLLLSLGPWRAHTAAETREVNAKNWGRDYAYYQAIQAARSLPGRIAFDHRSSIALALFGEPDRGRAVFADSHLQAESADAQWRALREWDAAYLVVHDEARSAFPVLADGAFRDRFTPVRTFEHPQTRGGTDRATIYAVTTGLP